MSAKGGEDPDGLADNRGPGEAGGEDTRTAAPDRDTDGASEAAAETAAAPASRGRARWSASAVITLASAVVGAVCSGFVLARTGFDLAGSVIWETLALHGAILLLPALCLPIGRFSPRLLWLPPLYPILVGTGLVMLQNPNGALGAGLLFLLVVFPFCGALAALALWTRLRGQEI